MFLTERKLVQLLKTLMKQHITQTYWLSQLADVITRTVGRRSAEMLLEALSILIARVLTDLRRVEASSREHAVWALMDFGFKVVIAPSFADIFYNNSFKNGFLPIALNATLVDQLFNELEQQQDYRLDVDLENQVVTNGDGIEMPFEIDDFRKYCLLNGFDDIGLTMQHADKIKAFEEKYYEKSPWLGA